MLRFLNALIVQPSYFLDLEFNAASEQSDGTRLLYSHHYMYSSGHAAVEDRHLKTPDLFAIF
jgi:hypothetical protein